MFFVFVWPYHNVITVNLNQRKITSISHTFFLSTYHSDVSVYVYDSFVCSVLIQFRENKFFYTKHHTIFPSNPNNCSGKNRTAKKSISMEMFSLISVPIQLLQHKCRNELWETELECLNAYKQNSNPKNRKENYLCIFIH